MAKHHKYRDARVKWHQEVRPRFIAQALDPETDPRLWAALTTLIERVDEILPSFEEGFLAPASVRDALARIAGEPLIYMEPALAPLAADEEGGVRAFARDVLKLAEG